MRRTLCRRAAQHRAIQDSPPLISISNATFYRQHPSSLSTTTATEADGSTRVLDTNPPLFPGLNFTLPSFSEPKQHWSILSKDSSVRTTFLEILRGHHICLPPSARSYPYLATDAIAQKDSRLRNPSRAIQYVGFDAQRGAAGASVMRGAYMSARYESRKEETDFSLRDYLFGNTELNADETLARHPESSLVDRIMSDLKLETLETMPVTKLSNGQTRRARIAKALLAEPELLLLNGPFMGLDPPTVKMLVDILQKLAESHSPRLVLSLRPDEEYPSWITNTAYLNSDYTIHSSGLRRDVMRNIHERAKKAAKASNLNAIAKEDLDLIAVSISLRAHDPLPESLVTMAEHKLQVRSIKMDKDMRDIRNVLSRDGFSAEPTPLPPPGEALLEMKGVNVKYDGKSVLGDWEQQVDGETREGLWWTVHRGQRWGVFGPNGSGKTTLISLITSDHPQTYSLPITIFGRSRLPQPGQPGISIFDIQSRIGHSSPEVHTFFPKFLTVRRTLESAWADTPLTRPKSSYEIDAKVNAALSWFREELNPSLGATKVEIFDRTQRLYQKNQQGWQLEEVARLIDEEDAHGDVAEWADHMKFADLTFSAQRVALFIRAVIRNPDLVVLDEAFSGMDDAARDKCILFLSQGQNATFRFKSTSFTGKPLGRKPAIQESFHSRLGRVKLQGLRDHQALIVISHKQEEVPGCVRNWICLSEPGQGPPRTGQLLVPLELKVGGWNEIWGTRILPMRIAREEGVYRHTRHSKNIQKRFRRQEDLTEEEKLAMTKSASQKWRENLNPEQKDKVLTSARARDRARRLKKRVDRLKNEVEILNSMSEGPEKEEQEAKVRDAERKVAGRSLTKEERSERNKQRARQRRGAAWLLHDPPMTKAEWEEAGRPGESEGQRKARLEHNKLARERMRQKRQEDRARRAERKDEGVMNDGDAR